MFGSLGVQLPLQKKYEPKAKNPNDMISVLPQSAARSSSNEVIIEEDFIGNAIPSDAPLGDTVKLGTISKHFFFNELVKTGSFSGSDAAKMFEKVLNDEDKKKEGLYKIDNQEIKQEDKFWTQMVDNSIPALEFPQAAPEVRSETVTKQEAQPENLEETKSEGSTARGSSWGSACGNSFLEFFFGLMA